MEFPTFPFFVLVLTIVSVPLSNSLPTRTEDVLQEANMALEKRPKYMDTRRELDMFKDLVLMSLQELVDEERVNPTVLLEDESSKTVEKRERYMGICMKKQYNNFVPVPCLRSGR
ncbi:SPTR prohormone [Biomphalaria pfeifferi]|uniref:SPTR prohormone n=1 Tax=Biomphalaria pfeifferi TaxID=112525 RepID=A0AAD8FPQ5_BIOPF|nr:SPTR prohormone [Biomphalaria pfeifferi]